MNKKFNTIIGIFLSLLLVVAIVPGTAFAASDTEDSVDEQTINEIDVFEQTYTGASLRFAQLEYALSKQALMGQSAIDFIQENYPEADVDPLNEQLAVIEALIDEVQSVDFNQDKESLASEYVDVKADAKDASVAFRDYVKQIVPEEDFDSFKEAVKATDVSDLDQLKQEIKLLRNELRAERINNIIAPLGIDQPDLVERIRSGEATPDEIKSVIAQRIKEIPPEERRSAVAKLKEDRTKREVFKSATKSRVLKNKAERASLRVQERSDKVREYAQRAKEEGFDRRAHVLGAVSKGLDKRSERLGARADNIKNRLPPQSDKNRLPPQVEGEPLPNEGQQ